MEEKIYEVLRKHKLPLKKREELIVDILDLFSVSLSLLGVARCPNGNCDNKGTIATQEYPSGEWIPEPCEWCHRKKELLNNEGQQPDK